MLFFLGIAFGPIQDLNAQTVMDRVSQRFLKKNRVKKYGKRLVNMGKDADLIDMAVRQEFEVIGFEPSWMIEKGAFDEHYFNLLNTLIVGEYDINPSTGDTRNRSSYRAQFEKKRRDKTAKKEFNIIQKADYHNPRINILMQLTYYGDYGRPSQQREYANLLLREGDVRKTLKDSIQEYLLELNEVYGLQSGRTGIVLDLQLENSFYNDDFIDFISYLRFELGDEHLIYLKIPSKVRNDALIPFQIISTLEPFVDRFIVKGYGFEEFSRELSPLTVFDNQSTYSVDGTIASYLLPGFEDIIQNKFIVELPWYGVIFKKDQYGNDILQDGSPYITIDDFNKNIKGRSGSLSYENDKTTAFYVDKETQTTYMIEDSTSLVSKYIYLVDSLGMNGFAINALGYYSEAVNNRREENWAGIADNFGEKREKIGWVIAYYLAAFLPIGFVYSVVRYWQVRNALAKFTKYWNRFRMFFILSLLIFMICLGFMPRYILVIVGLIIMGAFFIYIMVKKVLMRSKKYVNIVK